MNKIFENEFTKCLMFLLIPVLIAYLSSFISDKLILPVYSWALMSMGLFENEKGNYTKNRIYWFGKAFASLILLALFSYVWFVLYYLEGSALFLQTITLQDMALQDMALPAAVFVLMYLICAAMKWFKAS